MFTLKSDSTFDYITRDNAGTVTTTSQGQYGTITHTRDAYLFTDSSYGTYKIINDTLFLQYATAEIPGEFNGYNIRPLKLYWKKKSLYYIHSRTGEVLRRKEYYMNWNKWKAPNLSRADENYTGRVDQRR